MSLYGKYRPKAFDQVVGNTEVVASLSALVQRADPPQVLLFAGPTGCGKTTLARIVGRELGFSPDESGNFWGSGNFWEHDAATFRGIDEVRQLRRQASYMGWRAWLLDECHQLTTEAQNALLKLLEEPPPGKFYFLATTEPQTLLATVRGRCRRVDVKPLTLSQMMALLDDISRAEDRPLLPIVLRAIAVKHAPADVIKRHGPGGYPRFAIQLLERVLDATTPEKMLEIIVDDDSIAVDIE